MAKGGRRYARDARGRFSSTGATARGGRLSTASGKRRATVTAKAKGQAPAGTIGRRGGKPSKPSMPPAPAGKNNVRRYQPTTLKGWDARDARQIRNAVPNARNKIVSRKAPKPLKERVQGLRAQNDKLIRRLDRRNARDFTNQNKPGLDGRIAKIRLGEATPTMMRGIQSTIGRRAARAASAAARGSQAGKKALGIYVNQLAFTGKGKPKSGRNNLRPGPRNTQGPPKRTRKPRRKK